MSEIIVSRPGLEHRLFDLQAKSLTTTQLLLHGAKRKSLISRVSMPNI